MKKFLMAAALAASAFATQAFAFDTPTWDNCVTAENFDHFDTCELTFPPQPASSLVSINNPVDGYYHDHGQNATHSLEVRVNGSWVSIWSVTNSDSGDLIADIATPISFAGGTVDGVRFTVDTSVDQAYHDVEANMTFTFAGSAAAAAVPTMSDTALLLLALTIAAVGVYSQRRRFGNTA